MAFMQFHSGNKPIDSTHLLLNIFAHSFTGYIWNFTSQQWLTSTDSSQSVWWHHLVIIVPDNVDPTCDMGTLYVFTANQMTPRRP